MRIMERIYREEGEAKCLFFVDKNKYVLYIYYKYLYYGVSICEKRRY